MKSEIKNTASNVKRGVKNTFSKIKELFRKKRKKNKQQENEGSSNSSNIQETSSPTVSSPTVDTIYFISALGNKNGGLRKEIRDLCDYQCRNSSRVMCYVQE